jgi:hypothetical protein
MIWARRMTLMKKKTRSRVRKNRSHDIVVDSTFGNSKV